MRSLRAPQTAGGRRWRDREARPPGLPPAAPLGRRPLRGTPLVSLQLENPQLKKSLNNLV